MEIWKKMWVGVFFWTLCRNMAEMCMRKQNRRYLLNGTFDQLHAQLGRVLGSANRMDLLQVESNPRGARTPSSTRIQAVARLADRTASQRAILYWMLLNSISISVFEIMGTKCIGSWLDLPGSRDVISHVTVRFGIGHSLLVVFWNGVSISNGFRDSQWPTKRNGWPDLNDLCAKASELIDSS